MLTPASRRTRRISTCRIKSREYDQVSCPQRGNSSVDLESQSAPHKLVRRLQTLDRTVIRTRPEAEGRWREHSSHMCERKMGDSYNGSTPTTTWATPVRIRNLPQGVCTAPIGYQGYEVDAACTVQTNVVKPVLPSTHCCQVRLLGYLQKIFDSRFRKAQ